MIKVRRRSLGLPEDDNAYRKAIGLSASKPLPEEIPNWTSTICGALPRPAWRG